jgi:hypothetical protein
VVHGQPSPDGMGFIPVSDVGGETRGYAASITIQNISIRYPEFSKGKLDEKEIYKIKITFHDLGDPFKASS